jgi:predicted nucleic acid-binding protein
MVVFDTSLLLDISKGKKSALDIIASYEGKEQITTTVINKYELLRGANQKEAKLLSDLIEKFIVYDFQDGNIDQVIKAYNYLADRGKIISELDMIIAGIARANNETLLTRDKDFLNFEDTRIIVVK